MNVPAGSLLARCRLGEEARAQAHRRGEVFDGHLGQGGVVGGAQGGASAEIELQEPGSSFRVHSGQLDSERFESRGQGPHECLEPGQLAQAVAEAAGQWLCLRVPQAQLVLHRCDGFQAQLGKPVQDPPQHLARGDLAWAAVGPAGRGEADLPTGSPRQLVERAWLGPDQEVARAGPNAELRVVGDRRVGRVERQQEIGHDSSVAQRRLEGRRSQCLAADRPVDVGDPEQDELAAFGSLADAHRVWFHALRPLSCHVDRAHSFSVTAFSTSSMAALKRLTISSSSASVLV